MLDLALTRRRPASKVAVVEILEGRLLLTRGLPDPSFNGGSAFVAALDPAATFGVRLVQTIPLADGKTVFIGQFSQVPPSSGPPSASRC